jgi:hypothetical protein
MSHVVLLDERVELSTDRLKAIERLALNPFAVGAKDRAVGVVAERLADAHHASGKYVNGDAHNKSAEGFFAIFKRGLVGTFHAVTRTDFANRCQESRIRFWRVTSFSSAMRSVTGYDDSNAQEARQAPLRKTRGQVPIRL